MLKMKQVKDAKLGCEVRPFPLQLLTCQHMIILPVGTEMYTQLPREAHLHGVQILLQEPNTTRINLNTSILVLPNRFPKVCCLSPLQKVVLSYSKSGFLRLY